LATTLTFEKLSKPRYQKEFLPESLRLVIPSDKNWVIILFLGLWLMVWAVVETIFSGILVIAFAQAIRSGFSEVASTGLSPLVMLLLTTWVGIWTVLGSIVFYILLWRIKGVEEILISRDNICIKKITPVWTRSKSYVIQVIQSLKMMPPNKSIWKSLMIGCGVMSGGVLGFEYGEKIVHFGIHLDESVTRQIIEDIKEHCSSLYT
jgi:hypothetical protein